MGSVWRNYLLPEKLMEWRLPGWIVGEKAEGREGFEGLRRRLEGEGRARGVEEPQEGTMRRRTEGRGMGQAVVDQFRGMF